MLIKAKQIWMGSLFLAVLLSSGTAGASVIYNFTTTALTGSVASFLGVPIQLTLTDQAVSSGFVDFRQDAVLASSPPNPPTYAPVTIGSGVEQFAWGPSGNRLPTDGLLEHFTALLSGLPDSPSAGSIRYDGLSDNLRLTYNPSDHRWNGVVFADWNMMCGSATACTFEGHFVRVPEPATLAMFGAGLFAVPLLLGLRRRTRTA
jgi:hypothetical protein